jgi:hypothetical protein
MVRGRAGSKDLDLVRPHIHRVPLSLRAIELLMGLQGLHDELVFPSPPDQVPLPDMVLTTVLRRVKAPSSTPAVWQRHMAFVPAFGIGTTSKAMRGISLNER